MPFVLVSLPQSKASASDTCSKVSTHSFFGASLLLQQTKVLCLRRGISSVTRVVAPSWWGGALSSACPAISEVCLCATCMEAGCGACTDLANHADLSRRVVERGLGLSRLQVVCVDLLGVLERLVIMEKGVESPNEGSAGRTSSPRSPNFHNGQGQGCYAPCSDSTAYIRVQLRCAWDGIKAKCVGSALRWKWMVSGGLNWTKDCIV